LIRICLIVHTEQRCSEVSMSLCKGNVKGSETESCVFSKGGYTVCTPLHQYCIAMRYYAPKANISGERQRPNSDIRDGRDLSRSSCGGGKGVGPGLGDRERHYESGDARSNVAPTAFHQSATCFALHLPDRLLPPVPWFTHTADG
jgi:hypothetical protein